MNPRALLGVAAAVLSLLASYAAEAATLTMDPNSALRVSAFVTGNAVSCNGCGTNGALNFPGLRGSLSLVPVGPFGQDADVRFSLSEFSDANPLVVNGTVGLLNVPLTLRISEISYEFPAPTDPALSVNTAYVQTGNLVSVPSVTGTLRGSLTIGQTTTDFIGSAQCVVPGGSCLMDQGLNSGIAFPTLGFAKTVLGSTYHLPDFTIPGSPIVVDGVGFGVSVSVSFDGLTYVPEPHLAELSALGLLALVVARLPSRGLRTLASRPRGT